VNVTREGIFVDLSKGGARCPMHDGQQHHSQHPRARQYTNRQLPTTNQLLLLLLLLLQLVRP
jgi:hypothetical protein